MAKKKNTIIIDLGKLQLDAEQRKLLHAGIHKTIAAKMKKIHTANRKKAKTETKPAELLRDAEPAVVAQTTATIDITFTNTIPGRSELTATFNGGQKKITQSGSLSFTNVRSADTILIQVDSLGSTTATIDRDADPVLMNFPPGSHSSTFFIN
jgi:hypothetical protein